MATISENLQTIQSSMSAIKQAISNRGGDVSGDITTWANTIETMEGGGSSSGGTYSEVNHGTSDTTFTLTPNTFHVWDEVSSLTLTLGSERSGVANEFLFQFTSGATATTLVLPDSIKWVGGSAPTIKPNMIYQVSILKGLASVLEFDNAAPVVLISFTINGTSYQAEDGMDWRDWCSSKYNTNGYYPYSTTVYITGPYAIAYNNIEVALTDVIVNNRAYRHIYHGGGTGD
jgi:hypothetical protein